MVEEKANRKVNRREMEKGSRKRVQSSHAMSVANWVNVRQVSDPSGTALTTDAPSATKSSPATATKATAVKRIAQLCV